MIRHFQLQRVSIMELRIYSCATVLVAVHLCNAIVPQPPVLVKQPPHEQLFQVKQTLDELDKPFTLDCEADGEPAPTYRWSKDGKEFDYVLYDKRISQQPRRGTLVFTKPEGLDEGLYQCFAENVYGTAVSNSVSLRKSELNSFPDEDPPDVYILEGEPLSIKCNLPTGIPKPAIFWVIQSTSGSIRNINSSRITVDPDGDLHFSYVKRGDALNEAMYACSATSLFRNEYKLGNKINLKVEPTGSSGPANHPPSKQYLSPPSIVALRGQKLELSCIFGGAPLPDITWKKKAGSLLSNQNTYTNYGKTLQIKKVHFQDEGTYECLATNGVGVPQSHAMTVTVQSAPYWIIPGYNFDKAENETVQFKCEANGIPEPRMQWLVNGIPIEKAPPNNRRKVEGNVLTIVDLIKNDTAVYQCIASNVHGYVFRNVYLNVLMPLPPTITEQPRPVTRAVVSLVATLKCRVFGVPKPEVKWMRDLKQLTGGRYETLDSGDLKIRDTQVTDQGDYTCHATNKFGEAEATGKLEVKGKTKIILPPENVEVAQGRSATFRCNANADPSLELKIEWQFNARPIDFDQEPPKVVTVDNSLTIARTKELDSGNYTCIARTELDNDTAHATLIVQGKTKIIIPPENVEVAAGRSATFGCNANTDPSLELKIEWQFNEQPINFDQEPRKVLTTDNSLTITKSTELDSGLYTCIARTELDEVAAHATLTVQDIPNAPRIERVECNRLNAHVEWEPMGDNRAPILSYTIQFKTSFTPDLWENVSVNIPTPDTEFTVSMSPWANYTFRVIARNKIGPSTPSGPSESCTTPEDVPRKNPENVAGYGTQPDNLIISWTAMPLIEQNAPGFFYKIFWKRQDLPTAEWESRVITDWNQSQLVIEKLETYKPYSIKVEALNRRGAAHVAAKEVTGFSGQDVPRDAPQNFRLISISIKDAKSATFSWDPVFSESVRGHLKGYKIQSWIPEEGESRFREQILPADVTHALVTIFRPYSRNLVRVRAFNEMHNGPPSDVIEFQTPEGVPGPVESFDVIPMGSSALYLTWKKPSEPNGILTGYRIYYAELLGTQLNDPLELIKHPNDTRAKLHYLSPNSKYRVSIRATTFAGQGVPSYIETKTNKHSETVPDEPNFIWTRFPEEEGKAGIEVTWIPGENGYPGSNFYVQFKKKGENQWESSPIVEPTEDSYVLRGLELGQVYEMRVVSVEGPFQKPSKVEEIVIGGLGEIVPREAPQNFLCVSLKDAKSATFSWDPVTPESVGEHFKGYKIQTWTHEEGESRLREQIMPANVTHVLVTIFRPFSRNLVRVRAFNEMHIGPASNVIELLTPEECVIHHCLLGN